jgi:predicted Zn-dependent peptidase
MLVLMVAAALPAGPAHAADARLPFDPQARVSRLENGGEMLKYFESLGARAGAHINASTGFDQTIYRLDLPNDSSAPPW